MATKIYKFTGPVRWAKVWPGQVDNKFKTEARGGNWSVIMNLPEDQVKLYNALGLKNPAKTEEDILIANLNAKKKGKNPPDIQVNDVTFTRYERHPKLGDLGSPAVSGVEDGTSIGNNSICTTEVEIYPYTFEGQAGFASRLVSLHVDTLVEYVKEDKTTADADGPPVH